VSTQGGRRTVLVTGTGGTGVGAGIVQALTGPGARDRWDVVAADADPFSWGLYAAPRGVLVPSVRHRNRNEAYLARLREIIAGTGAVAVIPGTEPEAVLLATRHFSVPVPVMTNQASLMPLMTDKRYAQDRLAALGLPRVPSYAWPDRQQAVRDCGFPLVVKPWYATSGSRGLHLVTTQAELDAIDLALPPGDYGAYLPDVQPYLGDPGHEYTVGVLAGDDGTVMDSIVIRRELTGFTLHTRKDTAGGQAAVSTGFTQGYIVRDPDVQDYCERLAGLLGSRGPLNIQLRRHQGELYAFEIHPRFSGSAGIRASAGFNEADMLLRHRLDGEIFGRCGYQADVAAMRAFTHILVPMSEMLS
jgi:carbamoyl-phosphate synthase large subunit